MQIKMFNLTGITPTLVLLAQWTIAPLVTLSVLMLMVLWNGVPFAGRYSALAITALLLSLLVFREVDFKDSWDRGGISHQIYSLLLSWFWFIIILFALGYVTDSIGLYSPWLIAKWLLITPPLIFFSHSIFREILIRILKKRNNMQSVVIAGLNEHGKQLARNINNDIRLGLSLNGFFEDRSNERVGNLLRSKVLGRLDDLAVYVQKNKIDKVYIALPMIQHKRFIELLDDLKDTTASIYFVPDIFMYDLIQSRVDYIKGIPTLAVCETPFNGINGLIKRISDLLIASAILMLIAPILLLISIGVALTSRGPVIFTQRRYGLDGQEIRIYKFRTMTVCEDGDCIPQAKIFDPRVTPLGKLLRKTSLDELPQFFNVLQGCMSVVGPRPHAVAHNEMYRKLIRGYMIRHKVKPGITGWAQVNGLRGETDTIRKMEDRINHDLDYLRNWSIALDLRIILKTIVMLFSGENAH